MYISVPKDVYAQRKTAIRQQKNIEISKLLTKKQQRKGVAAWQIVIDFYSDIIDELKSKYKNNNNKENASANHDHDVNAGIIYPEKIDVTDYEILPMKLNEF